MDTSHPENYTAKRSRKNRAVTGDRNRVERKVFQDGGERSMLAC